MIKKLPGSLEGQIEEARRSISSDGYPMSIGELTNLYRDDELIIRPEFQRLFRWTDLQKSRLIESLLLGIPLPSIFVSQTDEGKWELVDGLQRVSTILQAQGELKDKQGKKIPTLTFCETSYLPALAGRQWQNQDPKKSLTEAQRLDVKRSKIDVKIIKRGSSQGAKFDLFQRLNSYGSPLTAQETRSALLVAASPDFFAWLDSLTAFEPFVTSTSLNERMLEEREDLELLIRFLVLHARPASKISQTQLQNFSQLLDNESIELAHQYPKGAKKFESVFKKTFETIARNGDDQVFRRWDRRRNEFKGSFLLTAFEVFGLGLGYHVAQGNKFKTDLLKVVKEFWNRPQMQGAFATGLSTQKRLSDFIPIGRQILQG